MVPKKGENSRRKGREYEEEMVHNAKERSVIRPWRLSKHGKNRHQGGAMYVRWAVFLGNDKEKLE